MKHLRGLTATAAMALALALPGSALAAPNTMEIGTTATLGPEGATVTVPVTVNCDPDPYGSFGYVTVTVAQASGHRLAQGSGSTSVPCTSSDETVDVQVGNFPGVNTYKKGRATASASIYTYDGSSSAGPQEIQITK
jgi:hypothetical protein